MKSIIKKYKEDKKENMKPLNNNNYLSVNTSKIEDKELLEKVEKERTNKIKTARKDFIAREKEDLLKLIKNEADKEEKRALKKEFKNKFKYGIQANKKGLIVELRGVRKFYTTGNRAEEILKGLDIDIKEGEIIVILGPSGSGKTTLLNVLSGLTNVDMGKVIVADRDLFYLNETMRTQFRADNVSFVFQSYNLIPTLTIMENIKVGENLRRKDVTPINLQEVIKSLGIDDQIKKYPYQLSGGQQQRVSIARALAKNPRILFADEPTGALDEKTGRETLALLLDVNKKYKTTLILVTHNPNFAKLGDRTLKIVNGKISSIITNKTRTSPAEIKWS